MIFVNLKESSALSLSTIAKLASLLIFSLQKSLFPRINDFINRIFSE